MVRATVRQWLTLPNDTSVGYFHTSVDEGSLGKLRISDEGTKKLATLIFHIIDC